MTLSRETAARLEDNEYWLQVARETGTEEQVRQWEYNCYDARQSLERYQTEDELRDAIREFEVEKTKFAESEDWLQVDVLDGLIEEAQGLLSESIEEDPDS
jgi:hypothetical protein